MSNTAAELIAQMNQATADLAARVEQASRSIPERAAAIEQALAELNAQLKAMPAQDFDLKSVVEAIRGLQLNLHVRPTPIEHKFEPQLIAPPPHARRLILYRSAITREIEVVDDIPLPIGADGKPVPPTGRDGALLVGSSYAVEAR